MFLKARALASKEDNTNLWEATSGPFSDEYWKSACTDIGTLDKMGAWDMIDRTDDMHFIDSKWDFKLKRSPQGLINKSKARFCARGDQQLENVDLF